MFKIDAIDTIDTIDTICKTNLDRWDRVDGTTYGLQNMFVPLDSKQHTSLSYKTSNTASFFSIHLYLLHPPTSSLFTYILYSFIPTKWQTN
jgi:hypothetical protein